MCLLSVLVYACALHDRWPISELLVENLRMTQLNEYLVPHSQVSLPSSLIGMDSEARNVSEIWNCATLCLVCHPKMYLHI